MDVKPSWGMRRRKDSAGCRGPAWRISQLFRIIPACRLLDRQPRKRTPETPLNGLNRSFPPGWSAAGRGPCRMRIRAFGRSSPPCCVLDGRGPGSPPGPASISVSFVDGLPAAAGSVHRPPAGWVGGHVRPCVHCAGLPIHQPISPYRIRHNPPSCTTFGG